MRKRRGSLVGSLLAAVAVAAVGLSLACSQNTLAALVTTMGNACSAAAGLSGNPALGKTIQADTATASQQVLAWKSGSTTQNVEQALNDLEADLSEIPESSQVAPFIDLGIATIDGILTDIGAPTRPAATTAELGAAHLVNVRASATGKRPVRHPKHAGKLPKRAAEFVKEWNKLVEANPKLAALRR
jgi:hypothetical protein